MDHAVGRGARQLGPDPGRGRNAAVAAQRDLDGDERPVPAHHGEEGPVQVPGLVGQHAGHDIHPSCPQVRNPGAVDEGVRILDRHHRARNAGVGDTRRARAGAPHVGARFQRAIQRRPARTLAGVPQRADFRVRPAGDLVRAAADHHTVAIHHDRADHRVGTGASASALRQRERTGHVVGVSQQAPSSQLPASSSQLPAPSPLQLQPGSSGKREAGSFHHCFSSNSASTYSSGANGIRSSIASPTPT